MNNNIGYVKLYRSVYQTLKEEPLLYMIYSEILINAKYEDEEWGKKGVIIPKGSFLTSPGKLGKKFNLTKSQMETCLKKLKELGVIETQPKPKQYTIIKIIPPNESKNDTKTQSRNSQKTVKEYTSKQSQNSQKKNSKNQIISGVESFTQSQNNQKTDKKYTSKQSQDNQIMQIDKRKKKERKKKEERKVLFSSPLDVFSFDFFEWSSEYNNHKDGQEYNEELLTPRAQFGLNNGIPHLSRCGFLPNGEYIDYGNFNPDNFISRDTN